MGSEDVAMERAQQAIDRIDRHEAVCAERYDGIRSFQEAISVKLDKLKDDNFKQWLVVAGGVITILLSIIGLLFSKVMGWI